MIDYKSSIKHLSKLFKSYFESNTFQEKLSNYKTSLAYFELDSMTKEQAIKDIVAYVQKLKPDERPKSHKFSLTTKTILRQKFNIHNQNFCRICDGLLHSSSTEVDHRIAMSLGGEGHIDNAVLLHPYCNRLKSDRTEEEARAALFGA